MFRLNGALAVSGHPRGGESMENLKRFFAVIAFISVLNGIGLLLTPNAVLVTYGIPPGAGAVLGFRLLGLTLIEFGLHQLVRQVLARLDSAARSVDRRHGRLRSRLPGFTLGDAGPHYKSGRLGAGGDLRCSAARLHLLALVRHEKILRHVGGGSTPKERRSAALDGGHPAFFNGEREVAVLERERLFAK